MINQYRKKPVVIEATQWFKDGDHPNVVPLPPVSNPLEERAMGWDPLQYRWIGTLEDGHLVSQGDWIITGVQGELYPCKPDIFAMTYEPVAALQATPQPKGLTNAEIADCWEQSDGTKFGYAPFAHAIIAAINAKGANNV